MCRVARFTESTVAYELYLKGRYLLEPVYTRRLDAQRRVLQAGHRRRPRYALAYAGLADAYNVLGSLGYDVLAPSEVVPRRRRPRKGP